MKIKSTFNNLSSSGGLWGNKSAKIPGLDNYELKEIDKSSTIADFVK